MHREITLEVNIDGIILEATGYYHPEEPMIMYDNNLEGYPGSAAEFELQSVELEGIEIISIISDEVYEQIIEQVLENYDAHN